MSDSLRDNLLKHKKLNRSETALLTRAQLLEECDRALVEAIVLHGQNGEAVSRMTGLKAYWIRRRTRRLVELITSGTYVHVMNILPDLSPKDAEVARLRYCQGLNLKEIGDRMNLTRYQLGRRLDRIRGRIVALARGRQNPTSLAETKKNRAMQLYPKGAFRCQSFKTAFRGRTA
jgi:predicted DNA-binding protein (UPF0251 family)